MCLLEIQEEQQKCGWMITKSIIILQFLLPKLFHLESKIKSYFKMMSLILFITH